MESCLSQEYCYEELKKCHYCYNWIEGKIRRVVICNKRMFYHPECYQTLIRKIERMDLVYYDI